MPSEEEIDDPTLPDTIGRVLDRAVERFGDTEAVVIRRMIDSAMPLRSPFTEAGSNPMP